MARKDIRYVHFEIANLCNAACPCCPRFNSNSPVPSKHLPLGYIDLKTFKKWFPPEILQRIKRINFCGNHGDPGANPDFPEIIDYISDFNYESVQFHTNGGMLKPSFWIRLAKACNKLKTVDPVRPVFSIDGLEDTNHLYRRNVKWNKLIENVKAFNSNIQPHVETIWAYLVFGHNEHQLDEAKILSKELGFTTIEFKAPLNLDDGINITPVPVLDKKGAIMYWINPTTIKEFKPTYLPKDPKVKYNKEALWNEEGYETDGKLSEHDIKLINDAEKTIIRPRCGENDLYIEATGDVHPCCFVATGLYVQKAFYKKGKRTGIQDTQLFEHMDKVGWDKFNLNTVTVQELLENGYLRKMYNETWNKSVGEGKKIQCTMFCGKTNAIDVIFESGRKDEDVERNREVHNKII